MKKKTETTFWWIVVAWFAVTIPYGFYCFFVSDSPPLAKVLVVNFIVTVILAAGYLAPRKS